MTKTMYIVRHGQTDLNKRGIIQGRGMDTNLNDEGRRQAALFFNAYKTVPFDKIYISELKRTQQSVQPFIDLGIPYEKLPGLDELGWGIHEGNPATPENKSEFLQIMRDWMDGKLDEKFEGGESPNEVKARHSGSPESYHEDNIRKKKPRSFCAHAWPCAAPAFVHHLTNKHTNRNG